MPWMRPLNILAFLHQNRYLSEWEALMDEFHAFIDHWVMLLTEPRTGVLVLLLIAAAVCEQRNGRVPHAITGGGIVFALAYNAFVPPPMANDWSWAWAGILLSLAATVPLYATGALAASDAKLMAMVGAFLGAADTAYALLFTILAAAATALLHVARRLFLLPLGVTAQQSITWNVNGTKVDPALMAVKSERRLAYGISIALGSASYVVAHHFAIL